jgi:LemA protein
MSVLVTVGALALLALWAMSSYRRLVALRTRVTGSWRQIAAPLKRRHDLVVNLIEIVKGAIELEREALDAVVAARNRAASTSGPADAGRRERELAAALARVFALAERHPQLTANPTVRALQDELAGTESQVSAARQAYNSIASKYNAAIEAMPGNIVAGFAGFKAAELFEMTGASGEG